MCQKDFLDVVQRSGFPDDAAHQPDRFVKLRDVVSCALKKIDWHRDCFAHVTLPVSVGVYGASFASVPCEAARRYNCPGDS